jgi:membrane-bound inhibitor of C-type lysozyme
MHRALLPVLTAIAVTACAEKASKEEEEAAKNTFVCQLQGERMVIRFDTGEARMLLPGGDRAVLYQVPSGSGVAFSNGNLELRGKGTELTLADHTTGVTVKLADCVPYSIPKESK